MTDEPKTPYKPGTSWGDDPNAQTNRDLGGCGQGCLAALALAILLLLAGCNGAVSGYAAKLFYTDWNKVSYEKTYTVSFTSAPDSAGILPSAGSLGVTSGRQDHNTR
jgi:hypothetical protein